MPYVIGFDENCYYAFAHSLFFDHDVRFANEYDFIARTQPEYLAHTFRELLRENPANPQNIFNCGTGLAAVPFLAIAHLIKLTLGLPISSFSAWYILAYYIANVTYGFGALLICYRVLRKYFGTSESTMACLFVVLCGPTFFYLLFAPGMSHATSAFFGTLAIACLLAWIRCGSSAVGFAYAAACGAAAGFAICIRPYNLPLTILFIVPLLQYALTRKSLSRQIAAQTVVCGACSLVGFAPQLLCWKLQYGHLIQNTAGYTLHIIPPYFLPVLFGRRHGLFFWSPALLAGIVGLVMGLRRYPTISAVLLVIFAGVSYMYSNWRIYWLGVSFGMRGFVDFPLVFAFGFAVVFHKFSKWKPDRWRTIATEVLILLFILNMHLAIAFRSGAIWVDGPLYWLESISHGKKYKQQLRREAGILFDYSSVKRVSIF